MPRSCTVCTHKFRRKIDLALASGTSYRDIAGRFRVSRSALSRHREHVGSAIQRASEKHEERLGDNLLGEMRRVQRKAWELLARTESEGDHRASIVALREVRECIESLGEMLARAGGSEEIVIKVVHVGSSLPKPPLEAPFRPKAVGGAALNSQTPTGTSTVEEIAREPSSGQAVGPPERDSEPPPQDEAEAPPPSPPRPLEVRTFAGPRWRRRPPWCRPYNPSLPPRNR